MEIARIVSLAAPRVLVLLDPGQVLLGPGIGAIVVVSPVYYMCQHSWAPSHHWVGLECRVLCHKAVPGNFNFYILCPLVNLNKGLSILLIFSTNSVLLILCIRLCFYLFCAIYFSWVSLLLLL